MSRRYWRKTTAIRPTWPSGSSPGRYLVSFTLGILGTFYYAGHKMYADSMPSDAGSQSSNLHILGHGHRYRKDAALHHNATLEQQNAPSYRDRIWENWDSSGSELFENTGIARLDVIGLSNHFPRQDTCDVRVIQRKGVSWTLVGLFNGHDGWENQFHITTRLLRTVAVKLLTLVSIHAILTEHVEIGMSPPPDPEAVNRKIKETFLELDNDIVHQDVDIVLSSPSKAEAMNTLGAALSGTSALMSFYDHDSRLLKIASAGDSRAILGRRSERKSGDQRVSYYEVHVLTADQNPETRPQLAANVDSGSNEGSPIRAFGLAAYKWSREIQEKVHREYLGDPPTPDVNMRPSVTAEPQITTIEVKPGDFLIMGSAGVWKSLTNEEAVGLVGLWLDRGMYQADEHQLRPASPTQPAHAPTPTQIIHPRDLPVALGAKDETVMYRRWGTEKRFVCIDINAAGHLARNVLGGADEDLTNALLSVVPPRSRKIRNDVDTMVIFFDG